MTDHHHHLPHLPHEKPLPEIPTPPIERMVQAVNDRDFETLIEIVATRDLAIQARADAAADRAVRKAIRRKVFPALIITGAAVAGSLGWAYAQQKDREHDDCVAAADTRDNFITYANGQTALWNGIVGIFIPPDQPPSGEVKTVLELVGQNAEQTKTDFPVKDRSKC